MTDKDGQMARNLVVAEDGCKLDNHHPDLYYSIANALRQARREGELSMKRRAHEAAGWEKTVSNIEPLSYEAGVVDGRNRAMSRIMQLKPETPEGGEE